MRHRKGGHSDACRHLASDDDVHPSRRQGEGDRCGALHGRPRDRRHGSRQVPLRRLPPRTGPPHRHREGPGVARGRRGGHAGRPARGPVRGARAGPNVVRQGRRAVRGRDRGGRGRAHRGDRRRGREPDRGGVRAAAGDHGLRGGDGARCPSGPRCVGFVRARREHGGERQHARLPHHRQGRCRRRLGTGRRRRQERVRVGSLAGRADRAARRARRVAGRRGHDLVLDAGSLMPRATVSRRPCRSPRPTSGSSSRSWAGGSGPSAISISRRRSPRSHAPRGAR